MGKLQNKNTLTTKPASEIVTRPRLGGRGTADTMTQQDRAMTSKKSSSWLAVTLCITRMYTISTMYANHITENTKKGKKHEGIRHLV